MKNLGIPLSSNELLQLKGGAGNCYQCLCSDEYFVYVDTEEFEGPEAACGTGGSYPSFCNLYDGPECAGGVG